jgi:hypothetical protein
MSDGNQSVTSPAASINADHFLRADAGRLREWTAHSQADLVRFCALAIVTGAGLYGAVMGCWRAPLQAFYVAIKLPLLIFLTALGNGLLNGMLAPLLGVNLSFRQSLTAVLVSFALASSILGALSPVALFVIWNLPPFTNLTLPTSPDYELLQLMLVVFIAFAGVIANVRLLPLLWQFASSLTIARNVLFAWLIGNLFLGSQLCWVLRPFIWEANSPVTFLGSDPLRGSFYETVFEATRRVIFQ